MSTPTTSNVESGKSTSSQPCSNNSYSKLKTYGFAVAIIIGFGSLAVAGVGVAGYFQVGALSNLGQVNSMIMMAAGSSGGIAFLTIGILGLVKNRSDRLIYGPEAWACWKAQIVGNVPPQPQIDWDSKDPFFPGKTLRQTSVLIFIPGQIIMEGKKLDLTPNALEKISGMPFQFYSSYIQEEIGDKPVLPGWVLMTKDVIPKSANQSYALQKLAVEWPGYRMPYTLEAMVCHLIVTMSGNIATRCAEEVNEGRTVFVSSPRTGGLIIECNKWTGGIGVRALKKF